MSFHGAVFEMTGLDLARADDEELLREAGADLVVTSPDDVLLEGFAGSRLERR